MAMQQQTHFEQDSTGTRLRVTRYFNDIPQNVWDAWTQPAMLQQWWAPKPWRAETKSMDFRAGGRWMYVMVGPDNARHCCRADYTEVSPIERFTGIDGFCDEEGNMLPNFPPTTWHNTFSADGEGTVVTVTMEFSSPEALQAILQMGFREGFTMAHENLDALLESRRNRPSGKLMVITYLNFFEQAEEALLRYQQVLGGEFTGKGIQRFGDTPMPPGVPPLSESDKGKVLNAEFTLPGGHVIMATDALASMGHKMEYGMNMHINLVPSSRAETERIFSELSEGGTIRMPLMEMFWGSLFASFVDKYGINWMLNFPI
jgi:PhnB protein